MCPDNILEAPQPDKLNYWLSRFVNEVRKQNGDPYPPKTVHQILAGLQRHMLETTPTAPKFLDRSNPPFYDLHHACDTIYRDLHSQGIGAAVKHTSTFTPENEEKLWSTGVVSILEPKALQQAVFYYVGKHFCIRGGEEQRKLGPSQFIRSTDPDCYTYVEHGSKNRSGGLAQLRAENKSVPCFAVPENLPVCLVYLLDLYLKRLPEYAFKEDVLYCRPKPKAPVDKGIPWYEACPVGKNKLGSMVSEMCAEAGIARKTNHSLRATGATTLFRSNVPEKIIQKTTGHRSLEALRMYERTSTEQHQAVSKLMMSTKKTSYEEQMQENKGQSKRSIVTTHPLESMQRVFENLSNCTIGNITINIGPQVSSQVDEEFDSLAKELDVDLC